MRNLLAVAACAACWCLCADVDVRDFGATGDGRTKDTSALQKAVDSLGTKGGRVIVPAGTYLTGTIWLKSGAELHLEKGAVLLGSPDLADYNAEDAYPQNGGSANEGWSGRHLILAVGQTDVAVTGEGIVDGNGAAFLDASNCRPKPQEVAYRRGYVNIPDRASKRRPGQELAFVECRGVHVRGVTLRNMAMWTCFFHGCDGVTVDGVTIRNDVRFANTDGFDIDACRNVRLTNCDIETADDALAVRGSPGRLTDRTRACEDVFVSNVVIRTECEGVRIGVGTGVVRRVTMTHLDIRRAGRGLLVQGTYAGAKHKGLAISDVKFSDIRIRDTVQPIVVTAGGTSRSPIESIRFERVDAEYEGYLSVVGVPACRPKDIRFRDCAFRVLKGRYVLNPDWEVGAMKTPLSSAICVEQADGVRFENVSVAFDTALAGSRKCRLSVDDAKVEGEVVPMTFRTFAGLSPAVSRAGLANPERGWRFEVGVGKLAEDPCKFTHVTDQWPFPRFRKDGVTVTQAYCYLTQFHDREISSEKIAALEADFARARKDGVKFLLRFAYDHNPYLKPTPDLRRLLAHIAQLKPVVRRNLDVIYCLQVGWVGAWGEFHSSASGLENDPKSVAAIMKATLDMLPPERMTMMRRVAYKLNALKALGAGTNEVTAVTAWSDAPAARIGFFNDGTLANWWDGGTFTDEPYADDSNWEYERVKREGLYTPVDGELFWSAQGEAHPCYACGIRAIDRFSRQHYTTFSLVHGHSLLNPGGVPWTIDGWKVTPVTPEELKFFGVDFDPAYFSGVPYRTAYEFIRDHLGYRLAIRSATLPVVGRGLVRLTLRNYGFAPPMNPREAVLVSVASDGAVREMPTGFDCRRVLPGCDADVSAEAVRPSGGRLALWLPDPNPSLRLRPEYAVRLATDMETATVGGRLLHFLD